MEDAFAREALAIVVKRGLSASDGLECLAARMPARGTPSRIRWDDGPELAAAAVRERLGSLGADSVFIEPASPRGNGYVERFDEKLPDALPDGEIFPSLKAAQRLIEAWRRRDDTLRLPSALGRPPQGSGSPCRPSGRAEFRQSTCRPMPPSSITQT